MIKKAYFLLLVCFACGHSTLLAQNTAVVQYINTYKFMAIREMQRTGVPASIKLAQGILETQAGGSDLVRRSNNHFGIKCKTGWNGDKVYHDDDERGECFRAYATAEDSYRDHSDFLKRSQRYAFLFQLDPTDYRDWAKGLKKAGYATNPKYTQQLIKYIEDYDLQLYTLVALGKKKLEDESPLYAVNSNMAPVISTTVLTGSNAVDMQPEVPVKSLRLRYPEGVFRINDTRVVVIAAGTPLLAIAEQYDIKYRHLLDFNELTEAEDIVRKDQLIFLQRKRRQGANAVHIARQGETLHDIAQEEAVRLDYLLAYNQLRGDETPVAGQQIFLQKDAAAHMAAGAEDNINKQETAKLERTSLSVNIAEEPQYVRHIVQSKETLFSIARKYEVEITQIRAWNRLRNDTIHSGQELLIYKN